MMWLICALSLACNICFVVWLILHQRKLRRSAYAMREAIRNREFSYRLSTDGLLSGERELHDTLNTFGQTIKEQLNQREVESWERMTRILTHEMMNAIAPIQSISSSLLARKDVKGSPLEDGISAIHQTARHMNNFVSSYRKMSMLENPNIAPVNLSLVISDIAAVYPQIDVKLISPPVVMATADHSMIRQILMNLIKNAIEANASRVIIELVENTPLKLVTIALANNGAPIPHENRQALFVPFFTTKRSGSGIGLSLSRRMMIQQGGTLELADFPHLGFPTEFHLSLPASPIQ